MLNRSKYKKIVNRKFINVCECENLIENKYYFDYEQQYEQRTALELYSIDFTIRVPKQSLSRRTFASNTWHFNNFFFSLFPE